MNTNEQGFSQEDMKFTAPTTGYEVGPQNQMDNLDNVAQIESTDQLEVKKKQVTESFNTEMNLSQHARNRRNIVLEDIECKAPEDAINLNQEGLLSRGIEGIDQIRSVLENGFSVSATPVVGADGEFGATEIPQVFMSINTVGKPIINQESFKFGEVWDDARCAETESAVFLLSDEVKNLGTFKDRRPMPEVTAEETIPSGYIKGLVINKQNKESIKTLMQGLGIDLPLYLVRQRFPEHPIEEKNDFI